MTKCQYCGFESKQDFMTWNTRIQDKSCMRYGCKDKINDITDGHLHRTASILQTMVRIGQRPLIRRYLAAIDEGDLKTVWAVLKEAGI